MDWFAVRVHFSGSLASVLERRQVQLEFPDIGGGVFSLDRILGELKPFLVVSRYDDQVGILGQNASIFSA